ncbi:hypothetical protein CDD83_260 [Cordyceps sp. RAO-2017]|nr:hypothetical protein CDD83_260 [Cordyceps sp. RAO-2017]
MAFLLWNSPGSCLPVPAPPGPATLMKSPFPSPPFKPSQFTGAFRPENSLSQPKNGPQSFGGRMSSSFPNPMRKPSEFNGEFMPPKLGLMKSLPAHLKPGPPPKTGFPGPPPKNRTPPPKV